MVADLTCSQCSGLLEFLIEHSPEFDSNAFWWPFRAPMSARISALECVRAAKKVMSDSDIVSNKKETMTMLTLACDDKKRLVRQAAVNAKNSWCFWNQTQIVPNTNFKRCSRQQYSFHGLNSMQEEVSLQGYLDWRSYANREYHPGRTTVCDWILWWPWRKIGTCQRWRKLDC